MKRFEAQQTYLVFMLIVSVFITILSGCGDGGGGGGHWDEVVTIRPVSSTVPVNGATGVPIGNKLTVTFSEVMDPATINTTTFTLKQGTTPISGTVDYSGVTAVFTPASNLAASTEYTATITTGAKNPAGARLAEDYTWKFTTGATVDTTAPTVSSTVPANNAAGRARNINITATFSEAMDPLTINTTTFTLKQGTTAVAGAVTYVGLTATFNPDADLTASTEYTAMITTGAKDLAGNALASNKEWKFTTGTGTDTTAPTVSSTIPVNNATGVARNINITATFSEAMDPLTITTTTFTLKQGTTAVVGAVTYVGLTATFNPDADLTASTEYTATITTGAEDLAGNALASNKEWKFTTGAAADTTAPTVSSTIPVNNATGVGLNSNMSATFSEAMLASTITDLTFTLKQGTTAVAGAVTYVGLTATFNPDANLTASTEYTATITTGATDLAGNALASNKEWKFTTGAAADTTAPTVSSTIPASDATGVGLNSNMSATFSEAMLASTITDLTFTLKHGTTAVAGDVTYVGLTATFNPDADLTASTEYTATITTGAEDLAGNPLATNYEWSFTTGVAPDTTAPTVSSTLPINDAVGVTINNNITATFSEAMLASTITDLTFTLKHGLTAVAGDVSYAGTTATFNPDANLAIDTLYTATITTGATDLAGNPLATNYEWTFTTGALTSVIAPSLGNAQNFAVIAAAGITNAAFATAITGDMATQPTLSVTGFFAVDGGPGTVDGTIYRSADALSTAGLARSDAGVAYAEAKTSAAAAAFKTVSGNLVTMGAGGSATFYPGAYHSTSTLSIDGSPITLDAQGDPNAVWIFDMESTLTTTPGGNVILANEAQAKNVFWRVGSSVTLGAAIFKGTILADTTIIVGTTGINVAGRLLAGSVTTSGAVNFNDAAHTVVRPAP